MTPTSRFVTPAAAVTLIHWGFAVFGGLGCLVFSRVSGGWKLVVLAMTLPPRVGWVGFVVLRARRKGLGQCG